jgi:hypothetical protein
MGVMWLTTRMKAEIAFLTTSRLDIEGTVFTTRTSDTTMKLFIEATMATDMVETVSTSTSCLSSKECTRANLS